MQPLKQVITGLRRQIEEALAEGGDLPRAARLEAERVVLSLRLSFQEQRTPAGSVEWVCGVAGVDSENAQASTLTIEFKPAAVSPAQDGQLSTPATTASQRLERLEGDEAERVIASLSQIFGAPGFDGSARATVFREAIAGFSDEQMLAIVASLSGAPLAEADPAAEYARHLIRRMLERSDAGVERGREILAEILNRFPVQPVSHLIEETWKTQDDWLDE